MKKYDYVIIGGGIAGVTAAETIRENDSQATIGIISDEPHALYSRVSLPAYIKQKIPREKLFLRTVDAFTKKRIDYLLDRHVTYLDVRYKEVGLTNQQSVGYGKLLIASGGSVRQWDQAIPENFVYRLQKLEDADRLYQALESRQIRSPLVIGGSFIALEFLDIFASRSLRTHLLVREPHFFGAFLDEQGGALLRKNFERHGVSVHYDDTLLSVAPQASDLEVRTKRMQSFKSDACAIGIGIERNLTFLQGTDIAWSERGVQVNEYFETNQEGVFAAGDVAEFYDVVAGERRTVGNWTNAFLQGKCAGSTMVGTREPFKNVSSYSIMNLGFQITAVGICTNTLEAVTRIDAPRNHYERFFMRDGVVVGAMLINRFQDKALLVTLIENRVRIDRYREQLGNFAFDIQNIPVVE
jgi:NAD(P)H-nitrite reductase large subunit